MHASHSQSFIQPYTLNPAITTALHQFFNLNFNSSVCNLSQDCSYSQSLSNLSSSASPSLRNLSKTPHIPITFINLFKTPHPFHNSRICLRQFLTLSIALQFSVKTLPRLLHHCTFKLSSQSSKLCF